MTLSKAILVVSLSLGLTAPTAIAQTATLSADVAKDWKAQRETMMRIADAMPEDKFGFKATPPQRSWGEQVLHVAGGNLFLMRFLNGKTPALPVNTADMATFGLKASTKAEYLKALSDSFDYGDAELVFEVRGLPSGSPYPGKKSPKRGAKPGPFVGNVWYGSEGFVVCPSYSGGVAYSNDGEILEEFSGSGDHFGNFIKAVRSGKKEDLNADILEGHLSSALCHLGNISYRVGTSEVLPKGKVFDSKGADDAVKSMVDHLGEHKVSTTDTKIVIGKKLTLDKNENFVGDKEADALLTREYRAGFVVPDKA